MRYKNHLKPLTRIQLLGNSAERRLVLLRLSALISPCKRASMLEAKINGVASLLMASVKVKINSMVSIISGGKYRVETKSHGVGSLLVASVEAKINSVASLRMASVDRSKDQ